MSSNVWISILDVMYNEMMVSQINSENPAIEFELPRHSTDDSVSLLSELTGYDQETINQELNSLNAAGLVEEMGQNTYGLTETGVRVAHERQQNRQQQKTQKILSYLTVVLAVSATGQFVIGIIQTGLSSAVTSVILIIYVVTLLGILALVRSDVSP